MIKRQGGVALAIVVWFIAGMSLLVAGIVANARVDTTTTQVHLARAKAVAAGDGAIHLALVQRSSGYSASSLGPQVSQSVHQLGDISVTVTLAPASGFINVSSAPKEVLAALFHLAGGLDPDEAQYAAENVIKWRTGKAAPSGGRRQMRRTNEFYSLEDLLRVEGVSRTLLDGIRDYAVAGKWASSSTDWSAAPESMMGLLKSLDTSKAGQTAKRRSASSRGGRSQRGGAMNDVFRADAYVEYGGRTWLRRRWMSAKGGGQYGLPWKVVRTELPRVVSGET